MSQESQERFHIVCLLFYFNNFTDKVIFIISYMISKVGRKTLLISEIGFIDIDFSEEEKFCDLWAYYV